MTTLIVPHRFRGPTESANGGYMCGIVAALMPDSPTVRLLSPPPLDTPLRVQEEDGLLQILHGDVPVAAGSAANSREYGCGQSPASSSAHC